MKKLKKALMIVALLLLMTAVAGCAKAGSGIHDLHGSIIGNEYYIDTFDNIGIRTMRTHGKKIDIDKNTSFIWMKWRVALPESWIQP